MSNKLTDQIRPLIRSALTGGAAGSLDGIVTLGLTAPLTAIVCASATAYIYQLRAGTDAESSPSIIRPDDYAGGTNEKVWALQAVYLSGAISLGSTFTLAGVLTPANITADQNDYAPSGLSTCSVLRLLNSAGTIGGNNINLTGLTGGADGRVILLVNISTKSAGTITLKSESSSSTAANRFGENADVVLSPNGASTLLLYDGTASRWRVFYPALANSSVAGTVLIGTDLAGTGAAPQVAGATGVFDFKGVTSPSQITSNQNNYTPGSSTSNTVFRIDLDADRTLTGMTTGSVTGRVRVLMNVSAFTLTLADESSSSTASNRFSLGGEDLKVPAGSMVILIYDPTSTRWRNAAAGIFLQRAGGTVSGNLTVQGVLNVSKIQENVQALSYAGTTDIDMSSYASRTLSLTGDVTFTTSNKAVGRQVKLYLLCDGTPRNFTFPSWIWAQSFGAPASIAAGKHAVLTLECVYGTADTDIVATYSEEA